MKNSLALLFFFFYFSSFSQEQTLTQKTEKGELEGSLLMPKGLVKAPLVIIVAGSGPTDRNGNSDAMENFSLKMLADTLASHNIASFRFDKRGVAQSSDVNVDESELRPETYVDDIKGWVNLLYADKRFSQIIIAGHSEGSLLGMLAAINNPKVKGFISIAGAGRPIDVILKEQFSNVSPEVQTVIFDMLDKLKRGDTLEHVPVILYPIFRPSVQPYMHAWMQYDPAQEIKKLMVPILITTGSTDIQVKVIDAEKLAEAQPKAQLNIIKNMNHVLKNCDTLNKEMQVDIYHNPTRPLNAEFSSVVVQFMAKNFVAAKKVSAPVKK